MNADGGKNEDVEVVGENGLFDRARRFWRYPSARKYASLTFRLRKWAPGLPIPVRLPCGAWLVLRDNEIDAGIAEARFETNEQLFVRRFLKSGMVVLDVGAHHGLYTVISARQVGSNGKVYAFEPSPRERKILDRNLRLNRIRNVSVAGIALGRNKGEANLFVVNRQETGCNSLRPPAIHGKVHELTVVVDTLDHWLREREIGRVDFIKLDVEGGELDVLAGAEKLLATQPRPVVLAEVYDLRTAPWGYPAKEIVKHLNVRDYQWFRMLEDGSLAEVSGELEHYDDNFVACPAERMPMLDGLRRE